MSSAGVIIAAMAATAKEDAVEFVTCPPRMTITVLVASFRDAPLRSRHAIVTRSDPIRKR
jgi:hypothetical protein